nr:MAG TPA: hypothetical protein [Caudoviricetes sp.]
MTRTPPGRQRSRLPRNHRAHLFKPLQGFP